MLAFLSSLLLQAAAPAPCPPRPQPMPAALDSAGEAPPASGTIAFAATPSEHPGRAWVVRLSRRGDAVRLEILVLRRRADCNLWDMAARWQAPATLADYRATARAIAPWATPPAGFPLDEGRAELALDGTGLELRVQTAAGWQVVRTLNHYGASGARLSAIFHGLIARHVPADRLPAADWRTRRAR